ncbi:PREDICTED: cell growth-regulating nucleolar protein-like [Branchiostoma belcheri]|uniref:Cell growth-regulating nucleolar protein n=1 Tax=Branchiostoma belcheri TaxID=7741 RepID=A0A6P4XYI3_BRABE|nr:PREDICTED: cell growth-regulating nucleolar protein-like [Branchiostoma belcheri]XP_019615520.1 PREDICTED: cell growth-regulating nucleolar protein-like [Branchiostoma belcheri]
MVFFNCNACGQTVKKNQVEKHYLTACRSCDMLSCLDCGKDFWGDDYKTHTQCISEEDKYGGKGITGHRMTKGEAKQDAWLKQVQKSMNDANASPQVRNLWERLSQYSNIPRKKAKFENFVKNSLRIHNNHLVTQVWEVFSAAQQQQQKEQQKKQKSESEQKDKEEVIKDQLTEEKNLDSDSKEDSGKISKRQRKEERRLKANKKEKKDRSKKNGDAETVPKQKKQKKSKKTEENVLENGSIERKKEDEKMENDDALSPQKAKKKKRKHQDLEEDTGKEKIAEDSNIDNSGEQPKKKKKKLEQPEEDVEQPSKPAKFPWESVISTVLLKADDHELSVKKLRKKVLAEFHAQGGDGKTRTEEKLLAAFDKKVNKNPRFKVTKE